MKTRLLPVVIIVTIITAAACTATDEHGGSGKSAPQAQAGAAKSKPDGPAAPAASARRDEHGHVVDVTNDVPAFVTTAADLKGLPKTLAPEQFTGQQRLGYEAVRAIPETIAQLPCYCHCDKGFGHKSLHSCFVDNHAAHCAVCIDEALMAYKMEKEDKLRPEQIRERIIAHYSAKH